MVLVAQKLKKRTFVLVNPILFIFYQIFMPFRSKHQLFFTILTGFFVTNAVVAELIGGKLIQIGPFVLSIGIVLWPVVFVTTDLINEFYGKQNVQKLSYLTAALITYSFIVLMAAIQLPAVNFSPVTYDQFKAVFGQSQWIIVGSIIAFLVSQLVDSGLFHFLKQQTGERLIWLRSTGSTVISQFIDTFIVAGIAFWLPGKVTFYQYVSMSITGYTAKLMIAVLMTPVIYALHAFLHKQLK